MEASPVLIETPVILSEPPVRVRTACPWGQIKAVEAVSLDDVMSEQLVTVLMEEETIPPLQPKDPEYVDDFIGCGEIVNDCSDDHLLAKMLQLEFDKEHDKNLKKVESFYNGNSKIRVSYDKYHRLSSDNYVPSDDDEDEDNEYTLEESERNHWHNFEEAEKSFQSVGRSGVSRQGNVTTTKHDPTICGRRNAGKMMEFFPCFRSGDGGKFDMKVSNNVYNSLRQYSVQENKRSKMHDKHDVATVQRALDTKTQLILFRLEENETLKSLNGCISTGKEACVYHAWSALPKEESPSSEFAVKIFKTTLNEFRNRQQYIKDDYRFANSSFSKLNPRKVIHLWAEKEMRNLMRIKEANIPCPEVVVLKKHILVMTFIGKDERAAPQLKDLDLPFEDMTIIYEQTVEIMKNMYSKCNLVHADLSEYNLLWFDDKTWIIDVSQSVDLSHPNAMEFLLRDCRNITSFFDKRGVLNVPHPEDLLFEIAGKRIR